jgi:CRP-like cAMP-binding protein
MRFLSLGTLAVLAAPGCADDAGGGAEPSATTHAAALSAATCEAVFACPAGSELGALRALLPEGVPACLATFHQRDAQARIAHLFCELYYRMLEIGQVHDGAFAFPASQQELADSSGITNVHANRTLQNLRRQGVIAFDGKTLTVANIAAL